MLASFRSNRWTTSPEQVDRFAGIRSMGLEVPTLQSFLAPQVLDDAELYRGRDLAQETTCSLPEWATVTTEVETLFTRLLQG